MPWQWLERGSGEGEDWTGFLEQGTKLRGDLVATGTFRVNSGVVGKLSSEGTLILGEQSEIEGEVEGRIVLIGGKLNGTVRASERVEIQSGAFVQGDIYAPCVSIASGGILQGRCHMIGSPSASEFVTIPIHAPVQS